MIEVFRAVLLALRSIRRNVLRTALTVLGILIGVAAVVVVTALGKGASQSISKQLDAIGSNLIFVLPQSNAVSGAKKATNGRLTEEDAKAIAREAVSVAAVSPGLQTRALVVRNDSNVTTVVSGVTLPFFTMKNWSVGSGELWTVHDEATKSKVCVIGETVKLALFGGEDPIGQTIRIGRFPFRVIGVLAAKGQFFGQDQDDGIYMPLGSVRSRFVRTSPGQVYVIFAQSTSNDTTERAVAQITRILAQRHHVGEAEEAADFVLRTQKEFQRMQDAIAGILTSLLVAVAAISLVVGGIGIMNIMLVSVTERTREIGIRMAIGAREGDIRTQFLVEAVVLSSIGGSTGALLGTLAIVGIARALGWDMSVSPVALFVALLISGGIGIAFGFFPARRASRLDPIEALRHE